MPPGLSPGAEIVLAPNAVDVSRLDHDWTFSGSGCPPVSSQAWGFWVWCQNTQAPPSVGKSNYETDCNGSLYFYDLHVVVHVTADVSEPSDGCT